MNAKNFLVSGIVGGIVNFLLGWLFYGILFESQFLVSSNGRFKAVLQTNALLVVIVIFEKYLIFN